MKRGELDLCPGSRQPQGPQEIDLLLRRVPEVALLPELAKARFGGRNLHAGPEVDHRARISRLADRSYLERLEAALDDVSRRAEGEQNGGLLFLAASLRHFVTSLPPERHPLIVALYFLSLCADPSEETPEMLALRMDDYEGLP